MTTMLRSLALLLLFGVSAGLSHAMFQDQTLPGHLYVQFTTKDLPIVAGKTGIDGFDRKAERYGVTVVEKAFPSLDVIAGHRVLSESAEELRRVYLVRYESPYLPIMVAEDFAKVPEVTYAEPIHRYELFDAISDDVPVERAEPNDPLYSEQTHLPRLELPSAWDIVKGSDGDVVIAIVDGGTSWQHEDLINNVWTNPNEVPGNGRDDDENGYIDDIHGWNFADNKGDPTGPPGSVTGSHGTEVAGAAAARTDNFTGISGSSWNAEFMGINTSCDDQQFLCFVTAGIVYAGFNGADVINASFGSEGYSETQHLAIRAVMAEGALVVAAAGNQGTDNDVMPFYPAAYPQTLSVGGVQKDADFNVFNYGRTVNVFAASVLVNSTNPAGYTLSSGTSFAAPLVSGVAALVKTAFPDFTPEQVREQIRLTAENIDALNPRLRGKMGRGRVNALEAVTQTPLPGIRVVSWSYQDQDASTELNSGDVVTVQVAFKNFHGDGGDINAELVTDETYLQWITNSVNLGTMNSGDMQNATFSFSIASGAPNNEILRLRPRITVGSLEDQPDLLSMPINEVGVAEHNTEALSVTITAEGNLGHTTFQGASNSRGIGFVATTASGSRHDPLFEGGLMIATSADNVSDCIRQTEINPDDQQEDFLIAEGSRLEIIEPGVQTSQQGQVTMIDAYAENPIGIEVLQESYIDSQPENEDFLIIKYTVTNRGGSPIENMHVGLFFDWDIASNASDYAAFDNDRRVGYLLDSEVDPTLVVGTRLLSDGDMHYSGIDNAATIYRGQGNDGFTSQEKWDLLSGGVRDNGLVAGDRDLSQIMAAGPFSLEDGASTEVAFGIVSGTSVADFLANADQAAELWKTLSTAAVAEAGPQEGWQLPPPYPHPAVPPVDLRFETAVYGKVQLDIYDLMGRRVRTLLVDAHRPRGQHTVVWDGHNDMGMRVAAGLYMVRMTVHSGNQTHLRSRPIMVVR